MENVKRTFSASTYSESSRIGSFLKRKHKPLAGICLLAAIFLLVTADVVTAANEFDGFLQFVRVCDRAPELSPSQNKLSEEKQKEFSAVWTQVGIAGKKLEAVWKNSVQNDPRMRRALKACDRYIQLEMQYNDLSLQLKAEYGAKQFREMEAKWANWSKTQANEWLDLEDRDLIRLSLWVLTYGGDQSWLQREPFSRFANQLKSYAPDPFAVFVENVISNQTAAPSREARLSELILTQSETLSEENAIKVYIAGIQLMRQQNKNKTVPEIPVRMQQYLKLRAEADYLFEAGETYLRITPRPEVEAAKQEFMSLVKKAVTLRPDLNEALAEVYKSQLRQN